MDSSLNALNAEFKLEESGPGAPRWLSAETIRGELQRILASRTFRAAKGQKKFLAYTVQEVLAGRAHLLKEYVIATEALDREASFDPRLDPIVRTEARKLRARLAKYYQTEGSSDPLRVELRKGSYVPFFQTAVNPAAEPPSPAKEVETPPITRGAEPPLTSVALPAALPAVLIARPALHRKGVFALFVALVLAVSSAAISYLSLARAPSTIFTANEASIAVLPLVNLGDSDQEFLSDGLTDELINALKQVPGLQVVARTSAFRFKAKTFDLREIDQKLHVRAVLVGTVRESETQLKVAVQLNNAETGYHLWSGSYERDSANIGTIAPEIANAVTNVLGAGLIRGGGENVKRVAVSLNSGAHEDYLRGLYFRNRFTVDSLNRAIEYFKQAITEDPSFAQAYAGLADCYAMARPVAAIPPLEVVSKIKAAASKAIELDGKLGEPHIDLAVSAEYEYDWATAEREFKKGLELSPDDVVGHLWYAWYLALVGRKDEVLTQRTIAARLDPVSPSAVESLGDYYSAIGHFDTAVQQFRSALALEPNFGPALEDLGETYLAQGRCGNAIEELRLANESMPGARRMADLGYGYAVCGHAAEARRILRDFLKEPQRDPVPAFAIAQVYIGLGDKDRAFLWLERAIDERDLGVGLNWDVWFRSLRSDPRFGGLLRRMKLA